MQERTGLDIPVHVDGASGAMIAPFCDPDLEWDFRLPRVASINTSGHKYGLVYPGVGWVVWRDAEALPEELVFRVNYLGGDMPTFALNFSRPGAQVVAQYYNFVRLGFDGYQRVQYLCRDVATQLSAKIGELGPFRMLTDGSELPVFAFTLNDDITSYSVFDLSAGAARDRLAGAGLHVPGEPDRSGSAAGRGAQRVQPRHGRRTRRRPQARRRHAAQNVRPAAWSGGRGVRPRCRIATRPRSLNPSLITRKGDP